MSGFLLKIATGSAAMPSNAESALAIADALQTAAQKVAFGADSGMILDDNGNTVGRFDYTEGDVEPLDTPILPPEDYDPGPA